ncbi:MAG: NADH-quinone oxidoreductase subunit L [Fibromonadaceae bacterium]|jgi:NADH-quinone oxidoreductase subunit L|nr:NADH-quinone oxidoreductase subunit L [Fibromonadaceae bacterium]
MSETFNSSRFAAYSWLILAFPLFSFLVNGVFLGNRKGEGYKRAAGLFSILMALLSMVFAVGLACEFVKCFADAPVAERVAMPWSWEWMPLLSETFGEISLQISFYCDPISVMMLVVISVIAFFVNIYSVGYMKEDESAGRFFALLSLFSFSMLGLVVATNLIQIYIFWELVGVSSYLLIGFWYHKPSAVAASKQAFILTRFADSFFLLGILLIGFLLNSFDFLDWNNPQKLGIINMVVSHKWLAVASVFVFIGAWGKSAMFPLHIWLPNAMEGPTPVSSIIHSATMVVAGVYLTARLFPFFASIGTVLEVAAFIGAFTALFAAIIACTQKDIKRILAYSTLSQLGYMMFALGVGGYTASMFHVFTHAFFKCMLFLIAGSVIHAVHSNNLDEMGGLRKKMPFAYFSCLIACLAIAGIPPFSGFWSKDEILLSAWAAGNYTVFFTGLLTGGLTAFYMFRMFFLAFHGKARNEHAAAHAHENPWMTFPIVALAIPAAAIGFVSHKFFADFVQVPPLVGAVGALRATPVHIEWLPVIASAMGVLGLAVAWFLYARKGTNAEAALETDIRSPLYKTIYNKFYFDEMYYAFTRSFLIKGVAGFLKAFDHYIIDAIGDFIAGILQWLGRGVRLAQNGSFAAYASVFITGIVFGMWALASLLKS